MPQLNSNDAGQLLLHSQRGPIPVRPVACFPWSEPNNYISLRNEAGAEVGFIHSAAELDQLLPDRAGDDLTADPICF